MNFLRHLDDQGLLGVNSLARHTGRLAPPVAGFAIALLGWLLRVVPLTALTGWRRRQAPSRTVFAEQPALANNPSTRVSAQAHR